MYAIQLTNFVAVQPAANKVDAMKNFIVLLYISSYDKGIDYINIAMTKMMYIFRYWTSPRL